MCQSHQIIPSENVSRVVVWIADGTGVAILGNTNTSYPPIASYLPARPTNLPRTLMRHLQTGEKVLVQLRHLRML